MNSVLIANTSTPPLDGSKTSVKMIEEVKHLPFSRSASYRRLRYARKTRKVLISGSGVYEWSGKKVRKIYRKLNRKKVKELHGWLKDHSNVVTSPNANDTVWVRMDDGEKVRETKLLLLCSVRELHNDLIESPEEGGFSGARNNSGEVLISDTALRKHMPSNLKNISNRHKQMCGCKICIISKQLHLTLMLWCKRRIKVIETLDKPRSELYQKEFETCSHDDLKA